MGTRERLEATPEQDEERLKKISGAVRTILEAIGEDPDREGLQVTPERYAKAMMFFTKGYEENLRDIVNGAVFHEDHDELVIVKDIEVFSLCEHHLVPFTGKVGFVCYCTADHKLRFIDAYRIHPQSKGTRSIKTRAHCRDVLSETPSAGTTNKAGRASAFRGFETSRCCCRNGVQSFVHGHAWCAKNRIYNDYELHAWPDAVHCKDSGRISEPFEPTLTSA